MPLFAVEYTYSDSTAADRDIHRPDHRAWLGGLVEQDIVRSSGPYVDGSGALIIFAADNVDALRELLTQDPFAKAGLIESVRATEWKPVMGALSD